MAVKKSRKCYGFVIYSYIKTVQLQQLQEMQSYKLGMLTHSLLEILPKNAF